MFWSRGVAADVRVIVEGVRVVSVGLGGNTNKVWEGVDTCEDGTERFPGLREALPLCDVCSFALCITLFRKWRGGGAGLRDSVRVRVCTLNEDGNCDEAEVEGRRLLLAEETEEYDDVTEGGRENSALAFVFGERGTSCTDSVSLASLETSPSTMMLMGEGGIAESDPNGVGRFLAFGVDKSKEGRNAVLGGGKEALLPKEVFHTGADGGGGTLELNLDARDMGRGRAVLGVNGEKVEEEVIRGGGITIVVRPWFGISSGELLVDEDVDDSRLSGVCSLSSMVFSGS